MANDAVRIGYVCGDCSHEFQVPIGGVELETYEFSCPGCGVSHRFTQEDIDSIVAKYEAAKVSAHEYGRKAISDMLADTFKDSKYIKYRPK